MQREHAFNGHATVEHIYPPEIGRQVELIAASDIVPEPIQWLWRGWLARGKFHVLAGAPGTGKTTIAMDWAATCSSGRCFPGDPIEANGSVLIWTGEDGLDDTLVPRLLACGADASRVHFVRSVREAGEQRPFDPSSDMAELTAAAREIPDLCLLVLDPVVAAVSGDSHKNGETRKGLKPVIDLGAELNCAVLGITHLSKGTSGREPLERVTGSLAFGAAARIVLMTVKPADPAASRRLVRAKSNIGPDTGGFEYQLHSAPVPGCDLVLAQRVDWREPLEGGARELMAVEQPDDTADALEGAELFLAAELRDGAKQTKDLKAAAAAHGYRWRTVERAKANLGVSATKSGFQGAWAWEMPVANTANTLEDRHLS